jgi:uncharacterized YkwD family protein
VKLTQKKLVTTLTLFLVFLLSACTGDQSFDDMNDNEFGVNRNDNEEIQNIDGQLPQDPSPYVTISSYNTDTPSIKYPHTKAIKVQEAKFKFVKEKQIRFNNQTQHQQSKQQHRSNNQQAPTQQPPQEQQQQAPAQQQPKEQQQQAPAQQQPKEQQQQAPEQQQPEESAQKPEQQQAAQGLSAEESKVIELTNVQRRQNGLPDLKADTSLSNVARKKSTDMRTNNYFSHTSPTYGSPFDMMRDFGVSYQTAGENIAQGQQTPDQVVNAWMNSEGHRKNILSDKFTHIGVGYDANGHHWTQMFIGK